jgi:hypothetical protein
MAPAAQSLALAVLLLAPAVSAFYLPGVAPQDYARVRLPETPHLHMPRIASSIVGRAGRATDCIPTLTSTHIPPC